jgi:hypothetical protein
MSWTIRGGVPLVASGTITENDTCCCTVAPDCSNFCDAGTIPAQIKVTIASMADTASDIGGVPCDNPGTCPTGDYFLDLVDTGIGNECIWQLCMDDPCNTGNKLLMTFVTTLDWTSTYLAWTFTFQQVCSSDCTSCGGAAFQQDVDQVIGDTSWAYAGSGFDCNALFSGTSADNSFTLSGVPSTNPYCTFTSLITITAVP